MAAFAFAAAASSVAGQRPDSAAFIVRLGNDTTAIESYVRAGDRLEAVGLTRSPRTVVRRYTVWFGPDGSIARFRLERDGAAPLEGSPAVAGGIPLQAQFYFPWELALRQARRSGGDAAQVTMLSGSNEIPTPIRRTGANEYTMPNQFGNEMRIRTDPEGRIVLLDAGGGSTVERTRWLDVPALAAGFASRDAAAGGLGPLSPLDSAAAVVSGADIRVVYSRPSLRGRDLAMLVPNDQVWRTGANDATTLRTSRALRFGTLSVPAGTYSVFTIPRASGWTLILNRQTDISGLDRDAGQDLGQVEMETRQLTEHVEQFTIVVDALGGSGVLRLRWGRVEASVPFRVEG